MSVRRHLGRPVIVASDLSFGPQFRLKTSAIQGFDVPLKNMVSYVAVWQAAFNSARMSISVSLLSESPDEWPLWTR